MTYSTTTVANNILSRSFAEKHYITPMKLQRILYFVASEYHKIAQRPLSNELFLTWSYGPIAYSVHDQFRYFYDYTIKNYARDARGNVYYMNDNDIELKVTLDRVWAKTKHMGAKDLSEITRMENSAWDKAFQNGHQILDPHDVATDTTYRIPLGLEMAPPR